MSEQFELTADELAKVAGGVARFENEKLNQKGWMCEYCGMIFTSADSFTTAAEHEAQCPMNPKNKKNII